MDSPLFMVFTFTLLALSDGFLILHARKEQCLLGKNLKVLVGTCKLNSRWQQWQWTGQGKLRLWQVDRCLTTVNTTQRLSRNLALQECARAPRWMCEDELPGSLGLAHPRMFLKKWGYLAVVSAQTKYYDSWLMYELGEHGEAVKLNLCPTQALQANPLKEDPALIRATEVTWGNNSTRGVTEQLIELTTESSSFSPPSSSPRSEDSYSTMTSFYDQTEKSAKN